MILKFTVKVFHSLYFLLRENKRTTVQYSTVVMSVLIEFKSDCELKDDQHCRA